MGTSTFLHSITKLVPSKPALSRVVSAALVAAIAVVSVLVVVPAVAGAAGPSVEESCEIALPQAAPVGVAAPKVSRIAFATQDLDGRTVLLKEAPLPRKSVAPVATVTGARKSSASRAASGGGWQKALVSWYGPGFYGQTMAGGGTLERDSMVVAHRSLPFGTRIMFSYNGRSTTAVVRDRGPYAGGRVFDLGPGTARALGFSGVGTVRYRILGR